ncbi:UDP-N-acetylglucosamine 2-epimerase [Peribacillus simplex]|uniref:UDP-N-acetylglucosamine 2-epimerase n=1 Tax=Peribacillus simplex TaxID=1478 RepID=UPI003D2B46E9
MYGEIEVNDYHLLKYSLLYDFFLSFSSVEIYGLPIAQCLVDKFLVHIQPFVDQNLENQRIISHCRKQQLFQTMGDINQKLLSVENISTVTIKKNKKSILLSDEYHAFAVDQLKEYQVTFYGVHPNKHQKNLPSQFESFLFKDEMLKINGQMVNHQKRLLKVQVDQMLSASPPHYYFSTPLFKQWFIAACMGIIKWVYILEQLILQTRPMVIINPVEASVFGGILGLLSKKYQITYINMPIILIGDRSITPSRADYYFVWGENQKNWLLSRKIKPEKITETGNIKYYYEMENHPTTKESFYEKHNIPSNHKILSFTTQPFLNTNDKLEQWMLDIPSSLPVTILIKKHRNDKYEYPLIRKRKNVRILSNDDPLFELLFHIDCLMTISSNTAIEAALFDKPLLILQPNIPYHYHLNHNQINAHLAKAQAGEIINNVTDLIQAVKKVTTEQSYVDLLIKKGKNLLSGTILTVDQAPILVKNKIEEIILNQSQS